MWVTPVSGNTSCALPASRSAEESFNELDTIADLRFRVELAQIMTPEDSAFYAHPNIIASVQPTHATSDMYWAEDRLGPHRIHHAYSYRRIFNAAKERVAFGTDFPIEHIDPLATFFAATTRQDKNHWPETNEHQMEYVNLSWSFWDNPI